MDNQKDRSSQDLPQRFIKEDQLFDYCYQKSSKLLKAIYFILEDGLSDDEVSELKVKAKSLVFGVIELFQTKSDVFIRTVSSEILGLITLIDLLETRSIISSMNAGILINEYRELLDRIYEKKKEENTLNKKKEIDANFFTAIPVGYSEGGFTGNDQAKKEDFYKGQYKGHNPAFSVRDKNIANVSLGAANLNRPKGQSGRASIPSISLSLVAKKDMKSAGNIPTSGYIPAGSGSDREKAILDQIRKIGIASIKDISTSVKGVSEKTVQRELATLVGRGVLKKEGERRWSRYSLI